MANKTDIETRLNKMIANDPIYRSGEAQNILEEAVEWAKYGVKDRVDLALEAVQNYSNQISLGKVRWTGTSSPETFDRIYGQLAKINDDKVDRAAQIEKMQQNIMALPDVTTARLALGRLPQFFSDPKNHPFLATTIQFVREKGRGDHTQDEIDIIEKTVNGLVSKIPGNKDGILQEKELSKEQKPYAYAYKKALGEYAIYVIQDDLDRFAASKSANPGSATNRAKLLMFANAARKHPEVGEAVANVIQNKLAIDYKKLPDDEKPKNAKQEYEMQKNWQRALQTFESYAKDEDVKKNTTLGVW